MVRPRPPISAATLAPTGNSPPGHDFTRPTHSMPITFGFSPFTPAHVQLGVVEAERLDLDDDVAGLGLGIWNLLVRKGVEASELLQDDCTHGVPPDRGWRV